MSESMYSIYLFVLAGFIGFWVIWNVTPSLHTPLISLTNAISGVVVVGAILIASFDNLGQTGELLGFLAVTLASINIFGGFVITQRMLNMFKRNLVKEIR